MNFIGRLFLRRGPDYERALKEASMGMVRVRDPELLVRMIARFIDLKIRTTRTGILLLDEAKNRYIFKASRGKEKIPLGLVKIDRDSPLIKWFTEEGAVPFKRKDVLVYEDLVGWFGDAELIRQKEDLILSLGQLRKEMERFKAAVCVPSFYKDKLLGVLILGEKLSGDRYTEEDINVLVTLANDAAMAIRNAQLFEDLRKTNEELLQKVKEIEELRKREHENYFQTILALAETIDAKDPYTDGHLQKVTEWGMKTAEELFAAKGLSLDEESKETIRVALRLHDIGKVGIPDEILHKPGPLDAEQWDKMKVHPEIGERILGPLRRLKKIALIIRHHHENYDGLGYPNGLGKETIPFESRIIAVVDAYHAMISKRPYRDRLSEEEAIEELKRGAGTQFDPEVVDAFLKVYGKGKNFKK